jgi:8-oxo-dGTP pyrophosphatase MutT (NUDIX family)
LQDGRLVWSVMDWSSQERSQYLQQWLLAQREAGQLSGWRGEAYRCWATPAYPPQPNEPGLFDCERAGFRYLGLRSHAVHINGWSQDGELWCGRRAASKATDPGLLDSLSAGGMTAGQSLWTVLQRELWEEAGLQLAHGQSLQWLGCTHSRQRVPEGWHDETLWVFNLAMTDEQLPLNQDGEVAEFVRLTPEQVVQHLCAGDFTKDAALALQLSLV